MTAIIALILAIAALGVALKLLFPLPDRTDFPPDPSVPATASMLADAADQLTDERQGETGLLLLPSGIESFAMRLAMVRNADRQIDAQYYIWEDDMSGRILLDEIIAAADRGVAVRMLIDDNPTAGLDPMWAAVASHPNIAVRLFNPMTIRKVRSINYLFDFPRLNRRMHNKSLTVDGAATIVGGRNIGDVYFGAADDNLFVDLDALAIGAVVPEVADDFARYWTSESAFPAELVLNSVAPEAIETWREPKFPDAPLAQAYLAATDQAFETLGLERSGEPIIWAPVEFLSDDPAKGLGKVKEDRLLAARLAPLIEGANDRFDLVSGYFVPTAFGTDLLTGLARRGVETRVVTNSIQVTDVALVHAGYVPSRKPLLSEGVELYEARPEPEDESPSARELGMVRFSGGGESVHAKTFAIDGKKLFVGSFNFDPRSALLNCEMGFLIDSPLLARAFVEVLDERVPDAGYRLTLNEDDDLLWTGQRDGEVTVETTEPGTSAFDRLAIWSLSRLPIAWLL